jgi:hypothetical protein
MDREYATRNPCEGVRVKREDGDEEEYRARLREALDDSGACAVRAYASGLRDGRRERGARVVKSRAVGLTYDAVSDIWNAYRAGDISLGRSIELLRDLAYATAETMEAKERTRIVAYLRKQAAEHPDAWADGDGEPWRRACAELAGSIERGEHER